MCVRTLNCGCKSNGVIYAQKKSRTHNHKLNLISVFRVEMATDIGKMSKKPNTHTHHRTIHENVEIKLKGEIEREGDSVPVIYFH